MTSQEKFEIYRKVDELGRIVLPRELRERAGIKPSGLVQIAYSRRSNRIAVSAAPADPLSLRCRLCGNPIQGELLTTKNGAKICTDCAQEASTLLTSDEEQAPETV